MTTTIKAVNLTQHDIVVRQNDGTDLVFPPSGILARVDNVPTKTGSQLFGVDLVINNFSDIVDLPSPQPDTVYIVSAMVLSALNGTRPDVIAPQTDKTAIRNDKGHIVAVRGFVLR